MSCGIYKITNTINNKSYIGQSINIEQRWQRHKKATDNFAIHQAFRKYGLDSFTFEIIEECDQKYLDEREIYWIQYYNSLANGYNMIPGGSNGAGQAKGFQVEQYNLDGQLLKIYNSAQEASNITGIEHSSICACCREEQLYAGNYQWKYSSSNKIIVPIKISQISIQRKVNQYDLKGNFLAEYNSLADAQEKTGIRKSTICNVCKLKGRTAGGYRWSYADEPLVIKGKQQSGSRKQVCQYDKNLNLIQIFDSITEASEKTGITLSSISKVCKGQRKTAGGYNWTFLEN